MLDIKKKLYKMLSNKYLPIIFITILFAFVHISLKQLADDIWFRDIISNKSLISYITMRYNTWTSRLIIETCLTSILSIGFWLWKIMDVIIIDILYISFSKLFNREKNIYVNWAIALLIILYNFKEMSSAGWAATTLNYIWPLSLGLFSLICFKKLYYNEHIRIIEYILYFLSLLYATNQEQMCIILLGVSLIFTFYYIFTKNKKLIIPLIFTIFCIGSLVFIFTTPGNNLRKIQEIKTWFSGYGLLTFTDKVIISITSTIGEYLFSLNKIFILFMIILLFAIYLKYKKTWLMIFPSIPIGVYLLSNILPWLKDKKIKVGILYDFIPINNMNFDKIEAYIPFIICVLIILSLLVSIYLIFGNTKDSLFCMFILTIGILSRMAMVFSPTLYASGGRTFIFLDFSMIIVIIMIIKNIKRYTKYPENY
ncbi:MAG: DUF6056 family protein [Clostridium sp.]|nr:DUF6056 family protein [Clostridium sp.]MCI7442922.1 DUF6056 family protein [Clostridium sp.]